MRIIPLAHQAIRNFVLIGLLLTPFSLSYAGELVGKPVAPSAHSSANASAPAPVNAPDAPALAEAPDAPEMASPHDDIHQAMEDLRENFHHEHGFDEFDMSPEVLIPIVAISLLFGGPILLVIILAFLHYRAKARRQQNINANIDKLLAAGRDIPVELLLGEEATTVKRNSGGELRVYHDDQINMQKGVRNIGLGTGWLIFLTIMFGIKIGAFGFIFIGLGISQVVIWKLSGTSVGTSPNAQIDRVQE